MPLSNLDNAHVEVFKVIRLQMCPCSFDGVNTFVGFNLSIDRLLLFRARKLHLRIYNNIEHKKDMYNGKGFFLKCAIFLEYKNA